jgi:hypothetical protein
MTAISHASMTAITNTAIPTMGARYANRDAASPIWGSSFNVSGLSEDQVKAIQKIVGFEQLQANWDSYGSPRVADAVIRKAIDVVMATFDFGPLPRILPVSGGGIQFEWEKGGRELEIEIHPDLQIEYLLVNEGDTVEPPRVFTSVDELLSWLMYGH